MLKVEIFGTVWRFPGSADWNRHHHVHRGKYGKLQPAVAENDGLAGESRKAERDTYRGNALKTIGFSIEDRLTSKSGCFPVDSVRHHTVDGFHPET